MSFMYLWLLPAVSAHPVFPLPLPRPEKRPPPRLGRLDLRAFDSGEGAPPSCGCKGPAEGFAGIGPGRPKKKPRNGAVLRFRGVRRPAAPWVFSLSSVVGSRPRRRASRRCPRVTGSYRPSGPRRCRRFRRSSGRACRHGSGLHRVPGLTQRADSSVGGRSLVRHATVCDELFAAEQAHPTRPGAAGRVRLLQEDAQAIERGKCRAFAHI